MGRAQSTENTPKRLVVGLSGASGVIYGIRLLEALKDLRIESHLVMSKPAQMTIAYETTMTPKQVAAKADHVHAIEDIGAPIASGSFKTGGPAGALCRVHRSGHADAGRRRRCATIARAVIHDPERETLERGRLRELQRERLSALAGYVYDRVGIHTFLELADVGLVDVGEHPHLA